jgi:hypothetical protein
MSKVTPPFQFNVDFYQRAGWAGTDGAYSGIDVPPIPHARPDTRNDLAVSSGRNYGIRVLEQLTEFFADQEGRSIGYRLCHQSQTAAS